MRNLFKFIKIIIVLVMLVSCNKKVSFVICQSFNNLPKDQIFKTFRYQLKKHNFFILREEENDNYVIEAAKNISDQIKKSNKNENNIKKSEKENARLIFVNIVITDNNYFIKSSIKREYFEYGTHSDKRIKKEDEFDFESIENQIESELDIKKDRIEIEGVEENSYEYNMLYSMLDNVNSLLKIKNDFTIYDEKLLSEKMREKLIPTLLHAVRYLPLKAKDDIDEILDQY